MSQSATIVEDDEEEQPQQVLCINLPPPASMYDAVTFRLAFVVVPHIIVIVE